MVVAGFYLIFTVACHYGHVAPALILSGHKKDSQYTLLRPTGTLDPQLIAYYTLIWTCKICMKDKQCLHFVEKFYSFMLTRHSLFSSVDLTFSSTSPLIYSKL